MIFDSGQRRALYDQFGEEGLKNGVPTTAEGAYHNFLLFKPVKNFIVFLFHHKNI